ncbi:MAG: hypothetical protein ACTS6A_02080 [Candidatus Hodgkinia cicadicola]
MNFSECGKSPTEVKGNTNRINHFDGALLNNRSMLMIALLRSPNVVNVGVWQQNPLTTD